jgi:hypothetical protein
MGFYHFKTAAILSKSFFKLESVQLPAENDVFIDAF